MVHKNADAKAIKRKKTAFTYKPQGIRCLDCGLGDGYDDDNNKWFTKKENCKRKCHMCKIDKWNKIKNNWIIRILI